MKTKRKRPTLESHNNQICENMGLDPHYNGHMRTTIDDLFVGSEFLCIYASQSNLIKGEAAVGQSFIVSTISTNTFKMNGEDWRSEPNDPLYINAYLGHIPEDYRYSIFIPITRFTDEELFHFRLSNNIDDLNINQSDRI